MSEDWYSTVFLVVYGVEESPVLTAQLQQIFLALIHQWDTDPRKSRILRQIMEYVRMHCTAHPSVLQRFCQVGCCGADGGSDFYNLHKPIPTEVS